MQLHKNPFLISMLFMLGLVAYQLLWLRCLAFPEQQNKTKENKLPVNIRTPQQDENTAVDEIDEHASIIYFIKQ